MITTSLTTFREPSKRCVFKIEFYKRQDSVHPILITGHLRSTLDCLTLVNTINWNAMIQAIGSIGVGQCQICTNFSWNEYFYNASSNPPKKRKTPLTWTLKPETKKPQFNTKQATLLESFYWFQIKNTIYLLPRFDDEHLWLFSTGSAVRSSFKHI